MAYSAQGTYLAIRPYRAPKRPLCGVDAPDAPDDGEYIQLHPQNGAAIHPKKEETDLGLTCDN